MKITKAFDYSLRLMVYLGSTGRGNLVSIRELSERIDIPKSFLGNIVQKLSAAGIVESIKGARGGIRLLRNTDDITTLEIMETVDGPVNLTGCQKVHGCDHESYCDVKPLMDRVQHQLVETLEATTITDLIEMGPGGWLAGSASIAVESCSS